MKNLLMAFCAVIASLAASAGEVKVTAVTAQQRYPWNGLVDIEVQLSGTAEEMSEYVCTFAATNVATKAELVTSHITKQGDDVGSGTTWTRHFIWDAKADVGAVKIDEVDLTVDVKILGGVQLWENGPYWAECNVGATKPEEYGYYFWWGDTVGYKREGSSWNAVDGSRTGFSFSSSNCLTYNKSAYWLQSNGYRDTSGNLTAEHDAATVHLGSPWRMPTDAEFSALLNNCDTQWTTRNGVNGRLIKGRGAYASKSIFLPAAGSGTDSFLYNLSSNGYYWSSTPLSGNSDKAWYLDFYSDYIYRDYYYRYYGQSVRPVR